MNTKRKIFDNLRITIMYIASFISLLILLAILVFIFSKGSKNFNLSLILSDYKSEDYVLNSGKLEIGNFLNKDGYENFSKNFGVAFIDDINHNKETVIKIVYIDENSPIKKLKLEENYKEILEGYYFTTFIEYLDENGESNYIYAKNGANSLINDFDNIRKIESWTLSSSGGGIRGSLIATMYLVVLTLLIGFPVGVLAALYLHEIAPKNKITNILRSFIDMLTGIPSIIYGLLGASLLISFSQKLLNNSNVIGGNILSGALTLSIMVLPVVIKTTESALEVVPKDYKLASLALGANEIQTTFKVVLPNAIPGVLSAALLTIGRVFGESAALIYAIGTVIKDVVKIDTNGTSLAVHIWSVMAGENPNIEMASSIAILILVLVLALNLLVKLLTKKLEKKLGGTHGN